MALIAFLAFMAFMAVAAGIAIATVTVFETLTIVTSQIVNLESPLVMNACLIILPRRESTV